MTGKANPSDYKDYRNLISKKIKAKKETLMAVTKLQKEQILGKFQNGDLDTGSCSVQVALLTARINSLTQHFETHKKDEHGRRGLVKLVNRRRKLLDYMIKHENKKYENLIKELDIRK